MPRLKVENTLVLAAAKLSLLVRERKKRPKVKARKERKEPKCVRARNGGVRSRSREVTYIQETFAPI